MRAAVVRNCVVWLLLSVSAAVAFAQSWRSSGGHSAAAKTKRASPTTGSSSNRVLSGAGSSRTTSSSSSSLVRPPPPPGPRGGTYSSSSSASASSPSSSLKAAGAGGALDSAAAAAAARTLFGNMIAPAAMLAGGLVPLGFLAEPLPDRTPLLRKLQCVYHFLSVASLANELLAIMYATVASNKLTEVAVAAPVVSSAFALIKRDYELHWLGCNVHFMSGLLGFVGMVLIRAYTLFPASLNRVAAGLGGSALLGMLSIVNVGVAQGDGRGHVFGGNLVTLALRYVWLLVRNVGQTKGVVALSALVLGVLSMGGAARNLFMPETYQPGKKK